jgi:hypothetical protein
VKVFISSVITGYDDIRQAAVEAIEALDHSVIRAEDFVAPQSAEVACLSGIRNADIVLVILGARYGHKQTSGMSATHQEFFEAKHCEKIVFVFVQSGVTHEPEQRQFIDQAQDWAGGVRTGEFDSPASLRAAITKALVRWERRNIGQTSEVVHKAVAALPDDERQYSRSGASLAVSVAVGPSQTVLRPTELEDEEFAEKLQKLGQFGSTKILDRKGSTDISVSHHTLVVSQSDRQFSVAEDGTICVTLPLPTEDHFHFAIVEEDVLDKIESILKFCALLLDEIDGTERISSVVPACRIIGGDSYGWSTRAKLKRDRSVSIRIGNERDGPVLLTPPMRSRTALRQQPDKLSEDLMVLLRRQFNLN